MENKNNIAGKINEMSSFVRILFFLFFITFLYVLWQTIVVHYLQDEKQKLMFAINEYKSQQVQIKAESIKPVSDVNKELYKVSLTKLKKLQASLADEQIKMQSLSENMMAPDKIPDLLKDVLKNTRELKYVRLRSMGVQPLSDTDQSLGLYKHNFKIEFIGNFYTTLEYLRNLENLQPDFIWEDFELNVYEYPNVNTTLEVSTLSQQKEWIGV